LSEVRTSGLSVWSIRSLCMLSWRFCICFWRSWRSGK